MGFGMSMFLVATGAILRWAVTDTIDEVNLATIGLILLVVGIIGAITSVLFWNSWGGFGSSRDGNVTARETTVERTTSV